MAADLVPIQTATTETKNKVNVAARYVGSNALGALTLAAALAGMPTEQAHQIVDGLQKMYEATQDFVGAFAGVWFIIFPIIASLLAKLGIDASGFGAMVGKVLAAAKAGDANAQAQVVQATGTLLANPQTLAVQRTDPNQVLQVKTALLDATAALPEVVGSINVTDAKLEAGTSSPQVVKAN